MRLKRKILWASAAGLTTLAAVSFFANRTPHSAAQIEMLADRLLEFGAVDFVHAAYDGPEQALFECVASGQVLNTQQSIRYRTAYQALLLNKQSLFTALDQNIELRENQGMQHPNNAGTHGIAGLHDHHDASAANNIADITENLKHLQTAWPLRRAMLANDIYKDLTDLMVHLAPAVHSVGLLPHDPMQPQTHPSYQAFYGAMKTAQAAEVNSTDYWRALQAAKTVYATLLNDIQKQVRKSNGALLHALSGKWLAMQTIAPRLSHESPSADARKKGGTHKPPCPS